MPRPDVSKQGRERAHYVHCTRSQGPITTYLLQPSRSFSCLQQAALPVPQVTHTLPARSLERESDLAHALPDTHHRRAISHTRKTTIDSGGIGFSQAHRAGGAPHRNKLLLQT
jgi:hypothetical protein